MSKKKTNKNIKCDDACCELESITISCTCDNDNCECTEETICQSFENTAGEITDNEYEVNSDKEEEE